MVGLALRIYLVTGENYQQRRLAVESIKNKVLQKSASPLNILTFYAKEINTKELNAKVLTFSFDKEKILIIKDAHNLVKETKDFLLVNLEKIVPHNYFIFETDREYTALLRDKRITSDKFFSLLLKQANIPLRYQKSPLQYAVSFDGFRQSIRRSDTSGALYILEKFFEAKFSDREKEMLGLQILGFLVGEYSYLKNPPMKKKCFAYLWDADRAIKEKGLEPRFALEVLLTKLLSA